MKRALTLIISVSIALLAMVAISCKGSDVIDDPDTTPTDKTNTTTGSTGETVPDETGKKANPWEKALGGEGEDWATSVIKMKDGGFIIAGILESGSTRADGFVMKVDAAGNEVWKTVLGGNDDDGIASVVKSADGGFAVAGYTWSSGKGTKGESDAWVVKLDAAGKTVWEKTYGSVEWDEAKSITAAQDGGFAVAGFMKVDEKEYDFWIFKLSDAGDLLWEKTFGQPDWDEALSIIQTRDGGFAVAGGTWPEDGDSEDACVIKITAEGEVAWEKRYGGAKWDYASKIIEEADGAFTILGTTASAGAGEKDVWVFRIGADGEKVWDKYYGGEKDDVAYSFIATSDGGYAVAGYTWSFGKGGSDVWLLKLANDGEMQWKTTYGDTFNEGAHAVAEAATDTFVVVGLAIENELEESQILVVKLKK